MLQVAALAVTLAASTAHAQTPGSRVRIETNTGVVEGMLVDRLPDGYLVRVGDESRVVPYSTVKSVSAIVDTPPAPPPPPAAPEAVAPPVVAPPLPTAAAAPYAKPAPPPPRSPSLVSAGKALTIAGALGAGVGVALIIVGTKTRAENQCHSGDLTFQCEYGHGSDMIKGGIAGAVVGGTAMLGGVVMNAVGSVPRKEPAAPRVVVAPAAFTLTWTF